MAALDTVGTLVTPLLQPVHPYFPIAALDLFGAMRLSSVVDWFARGVFDPPTPAPVANGEKVPTAQPISKRPRPSLLQEIVGILIIVFGPETFLCETVLSVRSLEADSRGMCSGTTPSWFVSPKIPLLFGFVHAIQTRTPFQRFLPAKPSFAWELPLALPDAIGRTLLLTKFSVLPVLHSAPTFRAIPPTPTSLLLVPFISAVPFAAIVFTGLNFFAAEPKWSTPIELRPGGWMIMDVWAPVVIPAVFLSLIGPVKGWQYGLGWSEYEAVAACMVLLIGLFVGRAMYNLGPSTGWTKRLDVMRKTKTE